MQLHSFRRNNAGTEFVCLNCNHSSTYCSRFKIKECPSDKARPVEPERRLTTFHSLLGMPYGYGDPYKRVFGIPATPLSEKVTRLQRANEGLHRIIGNKREQLNKALQRMGDLRQRLDVAEKNLVCEQGAYRRIVGLRRDDIKSWTAHKEKLQAEIETLKEVVKIERQHAVVLQKQFDLAIEQRDNHKEALSIQQNLSKEIIGNLSSELKSTRVALTVARSDKPVLTPFFTLDERLSVEEASKRLAAFSRSVKRFQDKVTDLEKQLGDAREEIRNTRIANVYALDCATKNWVGPDAPNWSKSAAEIDRVLPITTEYRTPLVPTTFPAHVGAVCKVVEPVEQADGTATNDTGSSVRIKKYPGVIWATNEALNAQFKHGASQADAQAYLDYCEAHSLVGPWYGFQQWKAIFAAASGRAL